MMMDELWAELGRPSVWFGYDMDRLAPQARFWRLIGVNKLPAKHPATMADFRALGGRIQYSLVEKPIDAPEDWQPPEDSWQTWPPIDDVAEITLG